MKIVTAEEMREIDRLTTEKYGVPSLTLMENAGTAVAEFAQKHFEFRTVCVICGKGNNGGDGFVAARKLKAAGKKVSVIILAKSARELRGDASAMFKKLSIVPLWVGDDKSFDQVKVRKALQGELIVDAILGTGFKPPLEGLGRRAVELINESRAPVLAVDIPSGAYSDSRLRKEDQGLIARADGVITFTAPKPVHVFGQTSEGPIAFADIGSPQDLILDVGKLDIEVFLPAYLNVVFAPRPADAHKGDFGHVLVIGGSVGKAGAAAMAGLAALRAGAGLVSVASPRSVQPSIASFAPELMTEPLPDTEVGTLSKAARQRIEVLAHKKDTVVLGPGLGRNAETDELVRSLLPTMAETKLVIDADGLNAFAGHTDQLRSDGVLVLTPHPGEMSRLTGIATDEIQNDRFGVARNVARQHDAIVVLKGHRTLTAAPGGEVWVNMSGNPGMAKGGSGDVLSGIIAASLNQMQRGLFVRSSQSKAERLSELKQLAQAGDASAARELEEEGRKALFQMFGFMTASAVCLHGLAGDVARDLHGESSMIATDMIHCIGEALAISREAAKDKFAYLQR